MPTIEQMEYHEALQKVLPLIVEMRARYPMTPEQERWVKEQIEEMPREVVADLRVLRPTLLRYAAQAVGEQYKVH